MQNEMAQAITDLDQAIRLAPADAAAFNNRGAAYLRIGNYTKAATDLREALRLAPGFPNPHRHLAWLQATCPQAEYRDGAAAVANATRALELAGGKPVEWCATLAAAHAEAGNFEAAVQWQAKCLDESPAQARAEIQARLELYHARQPFRDRPASPSPASSGASGGGLSSPS
jgi:tetratricopeptide (TPR) repeat protein